MNKLNNSSTFILTCNLKYIPSVLCFKHLKASICTMKHSPCVLNLLTDSKEMRGVQLSFVRALQAMVCANYSLQNFFAQKLKNFSVKIIIIVFHLNMIYKTFFQMLS